MPPVPFPPEVLPAEVPPLSDVLPLVLADWTVDVSGADVVTTVVNGQPTRERRDNGPSPARSLANVIFDFFMGYPVVMADPQAAVRLDFRSTRYFK